MAKLLFGQGEAKILEDNLLSRCANKDPTNELIKVAGATCYQTLETSKKDPEQFVRMIISRRHYSVIEHTRFCFRIHVERGSVGEFQAALWRANKLFSISWQEGENHFLMSGNARMFRAAWVCADKQGRDILDPILVDLIEQNPVLWERLGAVPRPLFPRDDFDIERVLMLAGEELLDHQAVTVCFVLCSRGLTHETVRHRMGSFSQESTRYVDYAKGDVDLDRFQIKLVLPYRADIHAGLIFEVPVGDKVYRLSMQDYTDLVEAWYRVLRQSGFKPEEARQWLPIGITSELVQTMSLKEWVGWFIQRTTKHAHPEIRHVALRLLLEFHQRFEIFRYMFRIHYCGSVPVYTEYVGNFRLTP